MRFFDFTVEPGKKYKYRVTLVLSDPNSTMPDNALAPDVGAGSMQVTVTNAGQTSAAASSTSSVLMPAFFLWPNNQAVATLHPAGSFAVRDGSTIATLADDVILLGAGEERGGVACRSYQHTELMLRALEARLGGRSVDMPRLCERVAEASTDLLDRRPDWLPEVAAALLDALKKFQDLG